MTKSTTAATGPLWRSLRTKGRYSDAALALSWRTLFGGGWRAPCSAFFPFIASCSAPATSCQAFIQTVASLVHITVLPLRKPTSAPQLTKQAFLDHGDTTWQSYSILHEHAQHTMLSAT